MPIPTYLGPRNPVLLEMLMNKWRPSLNSRWPSPKSYFSPHLVEIRDTKTVKDIINIFPWFRNPMVAQNTKKYVVGILK